MAELNYKLGKLPRKIDQRTIHLTDFVDQAALAPPTTWDGRAGIADWGVYHNDKFGDCTFCSVAHLVMAISKAATGTAVSMDPDQLVAEYLKLSPQDQGCVELDVLNLWTNQGILNHKALAFAAVPVSRHDILKVGAYVAGGLYCGVGLPLSARGQLGSLWDVTSGPDAQAGSWGGHCLAGDSVIPLLNGTQVTIRELAEAKAENVWVYGCTEDGTIVPARAEKAVKTKTAPLITVRLDDETELQLTHEHLVMMKDGSYKPAGQLALGDSLMPLYRQLTDAGYEQVWSKDRWVSTHHAVGATMGIARGQKTCETCGSIFTVTPVYAHRRFCSQFCAHKAAPTAAQLEARRQNANAMNQARWNHKVVAVYSSASSQEVFDLIGVSPTSNFACGGVFVHNSISLHGYDEEGVTFVTWGREQKASWAWWDAYMEEAYAVVVDDDQAYASKAGPAGLDLNGILEAVKGL